MTNEELRELLVEKYDYRNTQVDGFIKQINAFTPPVAAAFQNWLETGEIDDTSVEGYTVKSIMAKRPMKVVGAYLTLDWLSREPELAKREINDKPMS